jgi:hypothetical protein
MEYDYNYFLREKLQPAIELLQELGMANATFFAVHFDLDPQTLMMEELLPSLDAIEDALNSAKAHILLLLSRLEEFYASIENFQFHYDDLYARLIQAKIHITDFSPNMRTPDYLDFEMIPIAAALMPPTFEIPNFDAGIGDIDLLMQGFRNDALQFLFRLLARLEEEATNRLKQVASTIIHQLQELLTLEDYNPPAFEGSQPEISTMEEEANFLTRLGELAEANMQKSLKDIQRFPNSSSTSGVSADVPDVEGEDFSFFGVKI